jgi:hypothetical protein
MSGQYDWEGMRFPKSLAGRLARWPSLQRTWRCAQPQLQRLECEVLNDLVDLVRGILKGRPSLPTHHAIPDISVRDNLLNAHIKC